MRRAKHFSAFLSRFKMEIRHYTKLKRESPKFIPGNWLFRHLKSYRVVTYNCSKILEKSR